MSRFRELLKTTLFGGVLFLVPLVFIVAVVGKAYQVLKIVATPIGNWIPYDTVAGFAIAEFLTIAIMDHSVGCPERRCPYGNLHARQGFPEPVVALLLGAFPFALPRALCSYSLRTATIVARKHPIDTEESIWPLP